MYTNNLDSLKLAIESYMKMYDPQDEAIYLVGSRAREDYITNPSSSPSDFDLIVISDSRHGDANQACGLTSYIAYEGTYDNVEISQSTVARSQIQYMGSNIAIDLKEFHKHIWGPEIDVNRINHRRTEWDSLEIIAHQFGHLLLSMAGKNATLLQV